MLDKIIELLMALAVAGAGAAGVTSAGEQAASGDGAAAVELANETAALRAQFGLTLAAEARGQAGGEDEGAADAVDGLTQATEALTQAMDHAPDHADPGLTCAWEAVTGETSDSEICLAQAADAGAQAADAGAPTTVPPVTTPAADQAGSEVPAGPAGGAPNGRP